ncbi:MAG: 50S ribosomal protein L21 [Actinomycetaceae bacterium]|nr:50S ribosomal protein L21 [Actinomycetaceae bacterium]
MVYAIVKAGGRQEKVAVGDVVVIDKVDVPVGQTIELPAVMFVDGDKIVTAPADLAKIKVAAEIVAPAKGPKITIIKYKNKTGYRKRQGHRQPLTEIKVTKIG